MKFSVTVKPRSRQEKIEKTEKGYIVHIKEQPVENRANKALIRLLSEYFKISKSQVVIISGMKSKHKIIAINE
ncbi:MAG: DUF167 domain-containing protein [Nitrospirae bacterium]|nr:DUF167 domain-containing protein [Nitrospirota bacterium]